MDKKWHHSDVLLIRNIARSDGTVTTAVPSIVIQDEGDMLALFIPKGTLFKNNWVIPPEERVESADNIVPSAQRKYHNLSWWHDSIRLYLHGKLYSIWLSFDDEGQFASWYGNLEARFVRTPLGIDCRDLALDIVATPDRKWVWKDMAEFERRLQVGLDTKEHQMKLLAAGDEFVDCLEQNKRPFCDGWESWKPPIDWQIPQLSDNWQQDFGTHYELSMPI